ncbi:MAG: helix-turn-helix domain-containing protein, partial [Bacteroidales bacterium]|nr:helix-turn-helix domain-containing protein [Bacteroidales bacterium]
YGMSFSDYFNHLRIQHVTVLMREKKEAGEPILVKEIALQSGFNNASSFYRAFERETGMTPKQWIKKL